MFSLRVISHRTACLLAVSATAAVGLSACGSSSSDVGSYAPAAKPTTAAATPGYGSATAPADDTAAGGGGAKVTVHQGKEGAFLVDGEGRALYLWEKDAKGQSVCAGACASAWPPVIAADKPTAGDGVKAGLLATLKREDGGSQVTYAGHPLYRFTGDAAPGQTTGQGTTGFGAAWYVVRPSGDALDDD